jgi:hypothetical protein
MAGAGIEQSGQLEVRTLLPYYRISSFLACRWSDIGVILASEEKISAHDPVVVSTSIIATKKSGNVSGGAFESRPLKERSLLKLLSGC